MRNLITAEEVIELAFAENSNMRADSISETSIRIAEIKYIRPAFGAMYTLLADKYADYTNDYVKPALAYFVKCEIVSSIAIDMSNSGVAVANPQYQSAATDKQRQRLYDSEMSKAKTLLDFALEYIATHSEEFPDFSGEAPKKHHRVGGLLLGGGTSPKTSQSIAGDAFKNEIEGLKQSIEGKANTNGNYPNMTVGKAQGVVDISQVQEALTLTTKPNGNIVIGNLAGQSKEFMPATPSGDPMHYVYISVGATYDSNTGLWSYLPNFGGLTDITTSQMKTIFAESWLYTGDTGKGMWFAMEGRININKCRWVNTIAVNSYCRYANAVEVFVLREVLNEVYASEYAYSFTNCPKLKRIIGNVNISSLTKLTGTFVALPKLEEVRLKGLKCDVSFADSPNLSTESILYMIENATATSAITITLHEDAYMRAHENNDIIHALDIKEKVSIASA